MQLPAPVRAVIGLIANVTDEARRLPDRAIELPMLAVSTVLQMSLRAQQRYAALTARGDAFLSREPSDEPPPWATFDDPLPAEERPAPATSSGLHRDAYTDGRRAAQILEDILGTAGIATGDTDEQGDLTAPTPISAARRSTTTKRKADSPSGKPARKKAAKKDNGAAPRATLKAEGKKVNKPRTGTPSKFDDAGD